MAAPSGGASDPGDGESGARVRGFRAVAPIADGFSFEIRAGDPAGARHGRLVTPHGEVETPAFMPVGTQGTVKGLTPDQVLATGAQIVLANAYHLAVRPGAGVVRSLGGLHRFMGWQRPILTDSGGFQVFSLAELRDIDDDGVTFRSHVDGALVRLTPESVLEIEAALNPDIAMVLDHCAPPTVDEAAARDALERTIAWARRAVEHRERIAPSRPMAVFGIVQGGLHEALRREAVERLRELPFDGYAVGGVSVGEAREAMLRTIPWGSEGLPIDRPRYLMGVGGFEEFRVAIECGIDLFDCVIPTRNARNAQVFRLDGGPLRLRNRVHQEDPAPIEEGCDCAACRSFSRGFLHHLFRRREMLGPTLATIHNLRVFHRFLERARRAIAAGEWPRFREEVAPLEAAYRAADPAP